MKCIRFVEDGKVKIVRCSDEIARELVRDERAAFASKEDWKELGREYK